MVLRTLARSIRVRLNSTPLSQGRNPHGNRITQLLSMGVLIITAAVLVLYVWNQKEVFRDIAKLDWTYVVLLMLVIEMIHLVAGLKNKVLVKSFDVELVFKEWFGLRMVSVMTSQLIAFQGAVMALNAVYLKKKHELPYSGFASVSMGSYHLSFLISSLLGLLVSVILYSRYGLIERGVFILFFAMSGLTLALLFFSASFPASDNRLIQAAVHSLEGWQRLKSDGQLVRRVSFLILARILLQAAMFYVGYKALSIDGSFLPVLLMAIVNDYTMLIRITPGNLGVREALIALASVAVGAGFNEGLLLAALLRTTSMVLAFTLGPLFSYLLTRDLVQANDPGLDAASAAKGGD